MRNHFFLLIFILFLIGVFGQGGLVEKNLITQLEALAIPFDGKMSLPLPSYSGNYLAFTTENYKGIYIYSLNGEEIKFLKPDGFEVKGRVAEITDLQGSGFGFEWNPNNDIIAFRASYGDYKHKHSICVAHPDGVIETATPLLEDLSLPLWLSDTLIFGVWGKEDKIKMCGPKTEFKEAVVCNPEGKVVKISSENERTEILNIVGKRFFLPRYSPDGKRYLLHSLEGGIYLGTFGNKAIEKIGDGTNARFSLDGEKIVYEKTVDDGHNIIYSDLFMYEIETKKTYQITDTKDVIERMPSMAKDGHTIFFVVDGKIMRGFVK